MPSGQGVVERARKHIGEDYKFVNVPKDDASWRGPWDCAEFVSWLVYQEAGVLYGCDDDKATRIQQTPGLVTGSATSKPEASASPSPKLQRPSAAFCFAFLRTSPENSDISSCRTDTAAPSKRWAKHLA